MRRKVFLLAALALLVLASFVAITNASPPAGVTATVLARGTFPSFNVRSDPQGSIADFRAHSTQPIDIVVRRHDYIPTAAVPVPMTGWHQHPGPIFVTVTQGTLTYYELGDPTCTPHVVSAGQGFVDTGDGHIVRNESGQPAEDISVITAPVGGAFRIELPPNANPNCGF
jgi:Cupin domain